jgi:RNA polymerase sigma-70 factor (ECF subfamily)
MPAMSESLRELIERAQAGDSDAVAVLYRTHAQAIYRYIAYRVSNPADAEDLTAEVFLRMVEGLPAYRYTGAPFEAWLYRIAAARIVDHRRRASRHPQAELAEDVTDGSPVPEEQVQQRSEFEVLREAVRRLSDEHQTILVLRFVENRTHKEVANILGKTVTAVKTAQYRALTQLAALLGSREKARHYLRGRDD